MSNENSGLIEYVGQGDYLQNVPMSSAVSHENHAYAGIGQYNQNSYSTVQGQYQTYPNFQGYSQHHQPSTTGPNFGNQCYTDRCCQIEASCVVSGQMQHDLRSVPQNCQFVNTNNNNNAMSACYYSLGSVPTNCMGQVSTHPKAETQVTYNERIFNNSPSYLPNIPRKDLLLNGRLSGGPPYSLKRPRGNFRTMDIDSASSPEQDYTEVDPESKKRGPKKRKKKGANEPQKPVSAYALFFRDTQAAIKAENPNATFGEISKIVASMWDSLSEEAKQVYKQKTESAKRDYLKQLAAFRANLVSRGGLDADDEDGQPLSVLKGKMAENSQSSLPPMPKLQMAPPTTLKTEWPASLQQIPETNLSSLPSDGQMNNARAPSPLLVPMSLATTNGQATASVQISPGAAGVIPPPIQLRSIVPKAISPVAFLPNKPGQIIKVLPASQAASITNSQSGTRIIKMADMLRPVVTQSDTRNENVGSPQISIQPILQMIAQENELTSEVSAPKQLNCVTGGVEYIDLTSSPILALERDPGLIPVDHDPVMYCIREGCNNVAVSNPQWSKEYCSNECVANHCRDVFDAWVSARNVSASVN